MPKLFSLSKHTACLLSVTAALALSVPSAHGDGYFNNFYGKCDGAAYRLKLIKDSLVGSWNFSEDYSESGGTCARLDDRSHYLGGCFTGSRLRRRLLAGCFRGGGSCVPHPDFWRTG